MDVTIQTLCDAQSGDLRAQNILMRDLYAPVFHFVLKRTGNTEVANELAQTIFLKCYQRIAHYDAHAGTVYTWVFTIARHTLIDHYRKSKSESVDDLRDVPAEDVASDPIAQASAHIDGMYVAKLLQQLPQEEGDVVSLRSIQEMAYEDIGVIIGKNPEAVRQMYSRALKKLKHFVATGNHTYL